MDSASVCYEKRIVLISEGVILLVDLHNSSYHIPSRLIIIVDCYYCIGMPRFLKTELAKKSTYSTTYQLQTIIMIIQRPIKSLFLTSGSKLVVPRNISTSPNLK